MAGTAANACARRVEAGSSAPGLLHNGRHAGARRPSRRRSVCFPPTRLLAAVSPRQQGPPAAIANWADTGRRTSGVTVGGAARPRFAAIEAIPAAREVRRKPATATSPVGGAQRSAAIRRHGARAIRRGRPRRWSASAAAPAACRGRTPIARIARAATATAARAVADEEGTKPAKKGGVVVAATAACAAAAAAAATAAHGGRAAAAAVVRLKAPPCGFHRQQRAGGLPLSARTPMPRLLARRCTYRAAAGAGERGGAGEAAGRWRETRRGGG